uniref:HECT-type E3 ubiquitin transferase n=3 Tax=Wuchereria bancrofti TaxID=6293 RepID=A0AAF5PII3_WUCBA
MKIDPKTLRPCSAEIFPRCMQLIEHIKSASDRRTFVERLTEVHEWQPQFGKSEMARWSDVLNMCDDVLKDAVTCSSSPGAPMAVDEDQILLTDVTSVLSFTAMLFENTFTRSVYSSTDRLLNLLDSGNVEIVVETLRLLLVISKRSRFLSQHLSDVQQKKLTVRLSAIAQCWNGKLRSMKMDECCTTNVRPSALLPIGFQTDTNNLVRSVHLDKSFAAELEHLLSGKNIEEDERASFIARLRLVRSFNTSRGRRFSIIARLLSLSILVYTRSLIEEWAMTTMLYDGLIEEITRLLLINNTSESIIDAVKTEALRTLTSIVSLGRPAKLNVVIESLGVNSYHGFLARMTRQCVDDLRCGRIGSGYTTVPFCTALFSLLYHLAGFENGGEALVSCALTETLLGVVSCETLPLELITFVTRAVRVIDIMTSLDANGFISCNGMSIIVHRLIFDVNICMKHLAELSITGPITEQCHQQRAALIKSLLNFIKRAVQDTQFADSTRHIMDSGLPTALVHILSNCGFFGASLFHNAVCLITNFIYQEPSLLTSLQDKGVTSAILKAIFREELPTSRDVIAALPNTFTALCLNDRGLKAFMNENPFDHFCDIFVSTKYIYAMKCRRNEMNEVALNLGTSFDAFLRHHPTLRESFLNSFAKMLSKLLDVASTDSPRCVMSLASCRSAQATIAVSSASPSQEEENIMGGNVSSDDDDEDPTSAVANMEELHRTENESHQLDLGLSLSIVCDGNPLIPLGEYLLNIGKFLETLLTHNASPEQADVFVQSGTADKLLSLLFVRQIPLELSQSLFPQLVTNIIRFLFQHTRSSDVMDMVANRLNKFCLDMLSSCNTNEDSLKLSLLAMSSSEASLANICAISVFCSVLSSLSKAAVGSNTATKTAVLRFWTNEGCRLLASCNHAQRIVVWESAVLQIFNATNKCVASTQTDDVQTSEPTEEGNITLQEGSVGADSVPQRIGRPKYLLDDYWLRSKSGTSALNRCNRHCTELLSMLVKISIGGMTRTRRIQENEGGTPCENAVQLALQIMKGFQQALEWKPHDQADPAIMLPYLAIWINNLSNILFDERKIPYHLMLSAFYRTGTHDTFFNIISNYFAPDQDQNYCEVGQLLQAWLSLTERLVSAHPFRHSRYKMSERLAEAKRFPTEKYLAKCQQDAFRQANVVFGVLSALPLSEAVSFNICDMIISIYREIVKGIVPLTEKQKQAVVTTSEDRKKMEAELDGASIGLLVDMGFDRDAAVDALLEYSTVPEAAEYLIATDSLGRLRQSSTDERIDTDETDAEDGSGQNGDLNVEFEDVLLKEPISLNEVPSLDTRVILSNLCKDVIPILLNLMEQGAELVFSTSEVMLVILNEVDDDWRKNMLIGEYLVQDILLMVDELRCDETDEKAVISLSTRLHFICLLWPGIATAYMDVCTEYRLHSVLISVLDMVVIHCSKRSAFIRLIAPICLWLDLYDKMLKLLDSKDKVEKAVESYAWKYWDTDERGGVYTWINYPPAASHTLTNAFLAGRRNCNISVGGRQYTVDFPSMSHRNAESHIERPITISGRLKDSVILSEILAESNEHKEWNEVVHDRLVPAIIGLLGLTNIDAASIHAIFILAARITRDFKIAREFLQQGGVQTMINVSGSAVPSSAVLGALIIRHCLDDEISVRQIFEKTVRTIAAGGYTISPPLTRWNHIRTPRTTRDWLHAIRALSPLCARHPQIFATTMERVTRKQNDQITVLPMTPVDPSCKQWAACSPIKQVLTHLLNHTLDFSWEDSNRVVNRASLVRLIAELAKSYSIVATLVAESHDLNGQPFMVSILDKCIIPSGSPTADGSLYMAVKTFVAAIASCSHSPKAQETLISSIISSLHIVFCEANSKAACTKLRLLADLFLLARDACPAGPQDIRNNTNSSAVLRLIIKKRVCIELSRVPWYLNLSSKEGIETLNYVLRVLEELTRTINSNHSAQNAVRENMSESLSVTQNASASVTLVATSENDASVTVTAREGELSQDNQHVEDSSSTADEHRFETHEFQVTVERNRPDDDDYCADDDEDRGRTRHPDAVEDSSESEEDEDDVDDDDDDEGAGLNEMDVDDESDDEHDDVMEEEGRVSVEEEDDFGMVEIEPGALSRFTLVDSVDDSGPADRFEDGDSEENFVNTNIFVENLDDIDALTNGAFTGARLFVNTSMEAAHADRSLATVSSVHPLLQRSSQTTGSDSVIGQRSTSYRLLVGQRRGTGNMASTGLHRQNAVRRWTTFGTQSEFIERLLDGSTTANGTHLFDVAPSRQRFLNVVMQDYGLDSTTTVTGEERRQTSVPLPLERFSDAARIIDGHAHLYLWVMVASYITSVMDAIEKDENEKKTEEEIMKTQKDFTEESSKRTLDDVTSNESSSTTRLFIDEEEHGDVGNVGDNVADTQLEYSSESVDITVQTPSVSEPMDQSGTLYYDTSESLEDQIHRTCEQEQENATSNVNSEISTDASIHTLPITVNEAEEQENVEQLNAPEIAPEVTPEAPRANQDDFREILGDIEIPEGVDPAFLAALPEDIRTEVIRDHIRQQRSQRLIQTSANLEAASQANGEVPVIEPLDQEFLNALPPDLQEEILAQHERTVRLAQERVESNSAATADTPVATDDAAALIESLPPTLRAQVLADADDTVLQVLPQNVAAEARRLRASYEAQQVMRFARMLTPTQRFRPANGRSVPGTSGSNTPVGALAGVTTLASKNATQLLDRDAIVTLLLLFFIDPARLNTQRLQKLIKSLCAQNVTCDFVIWCLIALLDKVDEDAVQYEDFGGTVSGWLDQICVYSGIGQHEQAIKFFKSTHIVALHPAVLATVCRLVLDTLISLAKTYPGHFLPANLRDPGYLSNAGLFTPPFSQFWAIVHSLSKADVLSRATHRHGLSLETALGPGGLNASMAAFSLEDSAIGVLMEHIKRPVILSSSILQDKLLRLICTIVQTLPEETVTKLAIDSTAEKPPLSQQLEHIVLVLTEGDCSEEGLADGRTLLLELIRALTSSTKTFIMSLLINAAERLGARLLPHVEKLEEELKELPNEGNPSSSLDQQPSGSKVAINRYDESVVVISGILNSRAVMNASGCYELQLPAMKALTDKNGIQNIFLRTLQTIIKIREVLQSHARCIEIDVSIDTAGEQDDEHGTGEDTANTIEEYERKRLAEKEESMSVLLNTLEPLWELVSRCLKRLTNADAHAALALQPSAEAFFLVYGSELSSADPSKLHDHPDAQKLLHFAEKHRNMLNQVLRQNGGGLTDGPFAVLTQMPKLLDFDVKRIYFRKQMQKIDERVRAEDVAVRIRRSHLFSDSFRELFRLRGPEWKARFYIIFEGEEGQDAGGLLREWFSIITREIFNPNYALFITSPGDRVTYMINKSSYINPEHLEYFKFVGRIIAKAIYENKLLECYFTRAFYKHILSVPVRAQDLESEDPSFYKSLEFLLNNPIEDLGTELTFTLEVEEFGVRKMRMLKEDGSSIPVTDGNKEEYVKLVCQMKMTGSINQQLNAFLEGFYEIIPKHLISIFNEQELELLISGLPNVDIDDLYANTEYKTYTKSSSQIQWFWKALRSFEQEDRAKFLQFVTGTSKVPLQGFAALEGMNGTQKFSIHLDSRSSDRLPTAHTCFNQLDLPQYETYDKLRDMLLLAVRECTEGFGFA